ncbi:uncharacterized protein LOC143574869 [Bidens hawaiensis]|uniref:uncharacterized protein LOC143574869 n=1 Tax=Bidens hawaiensis TaxID=980011 RepID=UPI0040495B6D
MSRCFPFPPPGYEKKLVADDPDLLKKEKRREKKHKKDKKDKEKKDGKEKKEKNRSEGKHKEKKDKHRDKKKDKEKSDTSTPHDKTIYGQPKGYNGETLHHNNVHNKEKINSTDYKKPAIEFPHQIGDLVRNKIKVGDSENYKFVQELGRRIRDEKNGMGSHQLVEERKNNVNKFEMQKTDWDKQKQVMMDVVGFRGSVAVPDRIDGAAPMLLDRRVDKWKNEDRDKQKQEKLKEKSEQKKTERDQNTIIMKSDSVGVYNNLSTRLLDNGFLGVGNEGSLKKRKDTETNGRSHENEIRPNKIARPISNISPDNGRRFDFSQSPGSQNSLKVGSKGGQRVNGMIASQTASLPAKKLPIPVINNFPPKPSAKSPPVITNHVAAQSPPVSIPNHHLPPLSSPPTASKPPPPPKKKPPHPDTKYLNQILSVPKPDQWCSLDDQEWLFTSKAGPASNKPPTDDLEVQVWSEAKHIKSVDVCALPYVIPY